MIHLPQNRTIENHVSNTRMLGEQNKMWQDRMDKATDLQNSASLGAKKPLEMARIQPKSAIHATQSVSFDSPSRGVDDDGSGIEVNSVRSMSPQDLEKFDMKQDINKFVRPPTIPNKYLQKDELYESSKFIMETLEKSDASPALKTRAARLLQEEQNIKSIMSGYQNALIFS